MNLTPGAVSAFKKLMTNPKENGLDFQPLSEVFENTENATPKHILYKEYLTRIGKTENHLPKVFFYIIMDQTYKQAVAPDGSLGYCVRLTHKD